MIPTFLAVLMVIASVDCTGVADDGFDEVRKQKRELDNFRRKTPSEIIKAQKSRAVQRAREEVRERSQNQTQVSEMGNSSRGGEGGGGGGGGRGGDVTVSTGRAVDQPIESGREQVVTDVIELDRELVRQAKRKLAVQRPKTPLEKILLRKQKAIQTAKRKVQERT